MFRSAWLLSCVCVYFHVISIVLAQTFNGEPCETPKIHGQCLEIKECDPLLSILKKRPLSFNDIEYVRQAHCGFNGRTPKVCCPREGNNPSYVTPRPTQPPRPIYPSDGGGHGTQPNPALKLLPARCGEDVGYRIFGGRETELDEFPWMALLQYRIGNRRTFNCGGVLISKRYVLTAAHCVKGQGIGTKYILESVRFGDHNTETDPDCEDIGNGATDCAPPPVNIRVEEQIIHEQYKPNDPNQYHDIALLRLGSDVKFTDYVQPICLPVSPVDLGKTYDSEELQVAGWGRTENSSSSPIKLKLGVNVKPQRDCDAVYRAKVTIGEGQVCAGGERGRDSCNGDSGGPLMARHFLDNGGYRWYSAGIVSFGPENCGTEGWPGIYTRVSKYSNWILSNLKP